MIWLPVTTDCMRWESRCSPVLCSFTHCSRAHRTVTEYASRKSFHFLLHREIEDFTNEIWKKIIQDVQLKRISAPTEPLIIHMSWTSVCVCVCLQFSLTCLIPSASNHRNTCEINNALLLQHWHIHLGPSVWAAACTYWLSSDLSHAFGFSHSTAKHSHPPPVQQFLTLPHI